MSTKLYLPKYPSMSEGGVQPAFRQSPGGTPGFEAFQFDFNDQTADVPPPKGSIPDFFAVAPTISTDVNQVSKFLSGGPWNRVCKFPMGDGIENSVAWAFDARDYGNGVDLPEEGWKCQYYWGAYLGGGGDVRWAAFNLYTGNTPNLERANPGNGYRAYCSVATTNVRHYNQHKIDDVSLDLSDVSPAGTAQTNYYVWHEITVNYADRTVMTQIHDLQQGGDNTSGVQTIMDLETYPLSAHRYFGFHSTYDPNNQNIKLHHGWFGKLTDTFPTHLYLTT